MTSKRNEFIQREIDSLLDGKPPLIGLKVINDRIRETRQSIRNLRNGENWASASSNPDPIALDYATEMRDELENARDSFLMAAGGAQGV
jgi:hypothetical protein